MTSKALIKDLESINKTFILKSEFIEYLKKIGSFHSKYLEIMMQYEQSFTGNSASTQQKLTQTNANKNKLNISVLEAIRKMNPYNFITQANELSDCINESAIMPDDFKEIFKSEVIKLSQYYSEAYAEKNFNEFIHFTYFSSYFLERLNLIFFSNNLITNNLLTEIKDIPKDNEIIDIQLINNSDDLGEFLDFIEVIDTLYVSLCKVYNIHYQDFPLSIIKVESGSSWSQLFGFKDLISLIKDIVFGIGNYIRDRQTGVISREKIENSISVSVDIIELRKKAIEYGVDEPSLILLDKSVKKAVSGLLKSIPESTTEIILDDKKLLNLSEYEVKKIKSGETKLLKK
jgi:hypothetical protein